MSQLCRTFAFDGSTVTIGAPLLCYLSAKKYCNFLIYLHMPIPHIQPIFNAPLAASLERAIANKTKPLGSLGMLEQLARQAGLIQQTVQVQLRAPAIIVFAGDHGVVEEGVSAYPQSVTWQMVENFLAGGAAINVFARQNNCALQVVDAGVSHDFGPRPGLLDCKVANGTANFARESAMTAQQCTAALEHGMRIVRALQAMWWASVKWASATPPRPQP